MFFLLPVGVDYRARRYPVVTFTLMGICVVVWLIQVVLRVANGAVVDEWVIGHLWLTPSESHWWMYFTSMFVHAGLLHLAGNMIYLFLFGSCVEDIIGRVHYVFFYLLCGVAACFAHIAIAPAHFASEIPLGGASGAISGCIGGFLLLLARTKIQFKWIFFFFFRIWNGEFFLPAWLVISFWFLKDLVLMLLTRAINGGGVAFAAHVGGTLVGMGLIGLEKLRLKDQTEGEEEAEEAAPVATVRKPVARLRVRPVAVPVVAEAPTIYLFVNDAQAGPFTLSQIQQMLTTGAISSDAMYWQQGMQEWQTVEDLRQPGVA